MTIEQQNELVKQNQELTARLAAQQTVQNQPAVGQVLTTQEQIEAEFNKRFEAKKAEYTKQEGDLWVGPRRWKAAAVAVIGIGAGVGLTLGAQALWGGDEMDDMPILPNKK